MSFRNLQLINPIIRAITEAGYANPTDLQNLVIPIILDRKDVLVSAKSGKIASFAIPILQLLKRSQQEHMFVRSLILVPSGSIAKEIDEFFDIFSKYTILSKLTITEHTSLESHLSGLNKRIDVLIATPEKLLECMEKKSISFSRLEFLVLYDADILYSKTRINEIQSLRKFIPDYRQTLIFCNSISKQLKTSIAVMLKNPEEIVLHDGPAPVMNVAQTVYFVEQRDKIQLLIDLLKNNFIAQAMVFVENKYIADDLVKKLNEEGVSVGFIHGNVSNDFKNKTLDNLKEGKIQYLIGTEISAKAIDIEYSIDIINFNLPDLTATYLQRIDRVGRMKISNKGGRLISFCTSEDYEELKKIQDHIGFTIPIGSC